jgi:AcrR family transcriptional regulator
MRKKPEDRKEQILQAGIKLAEKSHYNTLIRNDVAAAAGVSPGLINHYFTSIENLRHDILERACADKILSIIAQAIVDNNPFVFVLTSRSVRQKALKAANINDT